MPSEILKQFDHVGIAVNSTDSALRIYRDILGGAVTVYKELGTTNDYLFTQFKLGKQRIELLEPIPGKDSFLTRFLSRWGEGLHHLTFQVENIQRARDYLVSQGLRMTDEFYEDPLWKTAFISPSSTSGVLIQLYETPPGSKYDHS
ncbi:MAG TPA: VOC family protein [Nitrososphaerales archaeon]|nr:VOC family protein [Nitrososphaerales archaeon]